MDKIYYQPNHLWKGQKAVTKLRELSAPKRVDRPHYEVTIPNEMHQFDLLYMPSNTLYGSKYKYILAGIDAASRYKVARPLRTKQARDVAEMIADIYKVGPLTYPKIFQCDNGSEFKGEVTKMLEKNEVKIRRVMTKYKHTHTEKVSSRWVKHLYGLVDELNDMETEMIGMKPNNAIKLKEVPLVARESYPPEGVLPKDGLYQYLLQPSEEHDDQ